MTRTLEFESSIMIDSPAERLFTVLADLGNDARWRREWVESKQISEGPIGVGTTFCLVGKALGMRMEVVYETTEYAPNRAAAWRAVTGPLPLTFRRSFEAAEGGTRVTFRYELEARGIWKLVGPLAGKMGRRQLEGDYPGLNALLATGPQASQH